MLTKDISHNITQNELNVTRLKDSLDRLFFAQRFMLFPTFNGTVALP